MDGSSSKLQAHNSDILPQPKIIADEKPPEEALPQLLESDQKLLQHIQFAKSLKIPPPQFVKIANLLSVRHLKKHSLQTDLT